MLTFPRMKSWNDQFTPHPEPIFVDGELLRRVLDMRNFYWLALLFAGGALATISKALTVLSDCPTTITLAAGNYSENGIEIPAGINNLIIEGNDRDSTIISTNPASASGCFVLSGSATNFEYLQ